MLDIVYILKNDTTNGCNELRYSLRSLKNIKFNNLYIIGGCPDWLQNAIHIKDRDLFDNKQLNALRKIETACETPEISDDFILMNDDFYIMKPVREIPYLHRGSLKRKVVTSKNRLNASKYWHSMKRTSELFDTPKDFEIHCPIVYNKKMFKDLRKHYKLTRAYLLRSLYCNHYEILGKSGLDHKIYTIGDSYKYEQTKETFLSSSDEFARTPAYERFMNEYFREASIYEKF